MHTRAELHRRRTYERLVGAARSALSSTGIVTPQLVNDVCVQTGLHPSAFRTFFATEDALLDAVTALLVHECAQRLQSCVANFQPPPDKSRALEAAARALAGAWPLERGGLLIRARRRVSALSGAGAAPGVVAAEKRFVGALTDSLDELVRRVNRHFVWAPGLAVRVILDTYERSFEAWVLDGHEESRFETSPYVTRTLPSLLREMTAETPHNSFRSGELHPST